MTVLLGRAKQTSVQHRYELAVSKNYVTAIREMQDWESKRSGLKVSN